MDKTLEQLQKNVKDAEDAFIATDAQDYAGQVAAIDAWFLARYHLPPTLKRSNNHELINTISSVQTLQLLQLR